MATIEPQQHIKKINPQKDGTKGAQVPERHAFTLILISASCSCFLKENRYLKDSQGYQEKGPGLQFCKRGNPVQKFPKKNIAPSF